MDKFVIPRDLREIIRSVRVSLVDAQIKEPIGRSGRVDNYAIPWSASDFRRDPEGLPSLYLSY